MILSVIKYKIKVLIRINYKILARVYSNCLIGSHGICAFMLAFSQDRHWTVESKGSLYFMIVYNYIMFT